MKFLFTIFFITFSIVATSQDLEGDHISTANGDIIIHPVQHASLILKWNNKVIYVDPYGGEAYYKGMPAPDLILITDIHGDHLNSATLDVIETSKATFVVPKAVEEQIAEKYMGNLKVLNNGGKLSHAGIEITALPMYNLPESADSRHTKGRGNGYVLNLGGKQVYISGDTEDIPEMRELKNIDIAFICMNLPFTMDVDQATDAVLAFKPAIVYPYHYRGSGGLSDVNKFKSLVNAGDPKIEVRLKDWYKK